MAGWTPEGHRFPSVMCDHGRPFPWPLLAVPRGVLWKVGTVSVMTGASQALGAHGGLWGTSRELSFTI